MTKKMELEETFDPGLIFPQDDWWKTAKMGDVLGKLGDLKRAYDRIAQIVLQRQQPAVLIRKCWTVEKDRHKDIVAPRNILNQCRRDVQDGRELFRDDGAFEMVDGVKLQKTAVCCSQLCYQFYQNSKPIAALSRH